MEQISNKEILDIISLEAENKILRKKIKIYEDKVRYGKIFKINIEESEKEVKKKSSRYIMKSD